ncbi:hypothetical protein [Siminovitchia sp. 179-K 8D1 HS]|uniref:hypothetical protein n=1 Tax=Siminovitchia sp. 179-K 8D1 HS TaxID=3142385 RepID=UPI00399FB03C
MKKKNIAGIIKLNFLVQGCDAETFLIDFNDFMVSSITLENEYGEKLEMELMEYECEELYEIDEDDQDKVY